MEFSLNPSVTHRHSSVPSKEISSLSSVPTIVKKIPSILNMTAKAFTDNVLVSLTLSSTGSCSCAAFTSDILILEENIRYMISTQNHNGQTDIYNMSSVVITDLLPLTTYKIYCTTTSILGTMMSSNQIIHNHIIISTACCKAIIVDLTSSSIISSKFESSVASLRNAITITLNARPSDSLDLCIVLINVNTNSIRNISVPTAELGVIFPNTFNVKNTLTFQSSIYELPHGTYQVSVVVTGISASEYELLYNSYNNSLPIIQSLPSASLLPIPKLMKALLANQGNYIIITFDSNTNKGRIASSIFDCDRLFSFHCASSSQCQWISKTIVYVYISCANTKDDEWIIPGDSITLLQNNLIKASGVDHYVNYEANDLKSVVNSRTILLEPPISPIIPNVIFNSPRIIGKCTPLILDITSSTGSGGRNWLSVSVSVYSTAKFSETAVIQSYLNNNFLFSSPIQIPYYLLTPDNTYNFIIELCNYLNSCSRGNHQIFVSKQDLPTALLPGAGLRQTIKRSQRLKVIGSGYNFYCDNNTTSTKDLTYKWILLNNSSVENMLSTSKNKLTYLLPSYSLQVSQLYELQFHVKKTSDLSFSSSNYISLYIYVIPGNIVIVLEGSESIDQRIDELLILDASKSFDEDIEGLIGVDAGLIYTWNCEIISPIHASNCFEIFDFFVTHNSTTYELLPTTTATIGFIAQVSLILTDQSMLRTAEKKISIRLIGKDNLQLKQLSTNLARGSSVINPSDSLLLSIHLHYPIQTYIQCDWGTNDDLSFNISKAALTETTLQLNTPASHSNDQSKVEFNLYLSLSRNTLYPGTSLTFAIICFDINQHNKSTMATIHVDINAPPISGFFIVEPKHGIAYSEIFKFSAQFWQDNQGDYPLSFQFGYYSRSSFTNIIQSKSLQSTGVSQLPAGNIMNANRVNCLVQIYDSLLASTTSTYDVISTASKVYLIADISKYLNDSIALSGGTIDEVKKIVAISNDMLNSASNCSNAPNCTLLNRNNCELTENTCGSCKNDHYIGVPGDNNEPCYLYNDLIIQQQKYVVNNQSKGCISSHDCIPFQHCSIEGTCYYPLKSCPADCSGHGTCNYIQIDSGLSVDICYFGSTSCTAVCSCDVGYTMSSSCSKTYDDIIKRQQLRTWIISLLSTLLSQEDPDVEAIISWTNFIAGATKQTGAFHLNYSYLVSLMLILTHSVSNRQLHCSCNHFFKDDNIYNTYSFCLYV